MAAPNYSFAKKQRELAKKQKKAEKLARKQTKGDSPEDADATDTDRDPEKTEPSSTG